jgi:hypothetical protein
MSDNSRPAKRMCFFSRLGLLQSQQLALDTRAMECFGSRALLNGGSLLEPPNDKELAATDFGSALLVGGVYAITLRYTGGYVPPKPRDHDIVVATFKGGHAQEHVHVTPALVTRRISINQVEVLIDDLVRLSYGSGPMGALDRYILHRDGCVRYWKSKLHSDNLDSDVDYATDEVCEWLSCIPRWEFTRFPVLPSVVHGV